MGRLAAHAETARSTHRGAVRHSARGGARAAPSRGSQNLAPPCTRLARVLISGASAAIIEGRDASIVVGPAIVIAVVEAGVGLAELLATDGRYVELYRTQFAREP